MVRRLACALLALACASCAGFSAQTAEPHSWPPFAPTPVLVGSAAPSANAAPRAAIPDAPAEELFACADGARFVLRISADRTSATARWNEGAAIALERADEAGMTAYAAPHAVLRRSGPRASWSLAPVITIKAGDTLSKLALALYGSMDRAADIAAANSDTISDPNIIFIGQELRLPANERQCRRVSDAI